MRKYIPYIFCVILLIFCIYQCESNKDKSSRDKANLAALSDTVSHYRNKLGTITASKRTLQLDKKQLQEVILEKDKELATLAKEFNQVKYITKFETVTKFDTIAIAFDKPLDSLPPFVRSGTKFTEWYSLGYKVNNEGITIEPFETWTETTVITGHKRKWLLGEETLTTDITFSNPYIQVDNMQTIEVVVPEPIHKKWYVWLAIGIGGGLLIK